MAAKKPFTSATTLEEFVSTPENIVKKRLSRYIKRINTNVLDLGAECQIKVEKITGDRIKLRESYFSIQTINYVPIERIAEYIAIKRERFTRQTKTSVVEAVQETAAVIEKRLELNDEKYDIIEPFESYAVTNNISRESYEFVFNDREQIIQIVFGKDITFTITCNEFGRGVINYTCDEQIQTTNLSKLNSGKLILLGMIAKFYTSYDFSVYVNYAKTVTRLESTSDVEVPELSEREQIISFYTDNEFSFEIDRDDVIISIGKKTRIKLEITVLHKESGLKMFYQSVKYKAISGELLYQHIKRINALL